MAVGTKFALLYAYIFLDYIKTEFLKTHVEKLILCKSFMDIFFIWTGSEENSNKFSEDLNKYYPISMLHTRNLKKALTFWI